MGEQVYGADVCSACGHFGVDHIVLLDGPPHCRCGCTDWSAAARCRAFNYTAKVDGTWSFRCEHCGEMREGNGPPPPCPGRALPPPTDTPI